MEAVFGQVAWSACPRRGGESRDWKAESLADLWPKRALWETATGGAKVLGSAQLGRSSRRRRERAVGRAVAAGARVGARRLPYKVPCGAAAALGHCVLGLPAGACAEGAGPAGSGRGAWRGGHCTKRRCGTRSRSAPASGRGDARGGGAPGLAHSRHSPARPQHTCHAWRAACPLALGPRSLGRVRPRLPGPPAPRRRRPGCVCGRVGGRGLGRWLRAGVAGASRAAWWLGQRVPVGAVPWVAGLGGGGGVGSVDVWMGEGPAWVSMEPSGKRPDMWRQRGSIQALVAVRVQGVGAWDGSCRPGMWRRVCGGLAARRPSGGVDLDGGGEGRVQRQRLRPA